MPVLVALELCSFITSNLFCHRHSILSGFVRLSNDFVGLDRVFETALWLSSALTIDNTLFRISFCSCSNLMHVACWEVILHLEFSYFASPVWVLTLGIGLFVRWLSCSLSWWPLLFLYCSVALSKLVFGCNFFSSVFLIRGMSLLKQMRCHFFSISSF